MSVINGKQIAEGALTELKENISGLSQKPRLAIVQVGTNAASTQFVNRKKTVGEQLGVDVRIHTYAEDISTAELRKRLAVLAHEKGTDGIIVQLPLPDKLNTEYLVNAIPPEKDVDVLSTKSMGLFASGKLLTTPPVVAAAKKLLKNVSMDVKGKHCVVVGAGRLVGRPLALWLMNQGAILTVVGEPTDSLSKVLADADIIFLGAGSPNIVNAHMLKAGTVVIDAGSGIDAEGKIAGDFDAADADERNITYSPVPGGVGPLTVVVIFENLLTLVSGSKK